jgi:hypothetical protein
MAKTKPQAQINVADGRGGMVPVTDRRFEDTKRWPIRITVPKDNADSWLEYFNDECRLRGWSSDGISQLEASENSGTLNVNSGSPDKPELSVVWERKRAGGLHIRACSGGAAPLQDSELRQLFTDVTARCAAGITLKIHRSWHLEYHGLPWRGELWLDNTIRLSPSSLQYEGALFGPRSIIVDAEVSCIGQGDAPAVFHRLLDELAMFLSVLMSTDVHPTPAGRSAWTWETGAKDCAVRNVGYWEPHYLAQMPTPQQFPSVRLRTRPDAISQAHDDQMPGEISVPSDTVDLWKHFNALAPDLRRQFLQAAAKWQEAVAHWSNRDTLSVALMVVACEALKPTDGQFRNRNIYDVVEGLLGADAVKRLDVGWFRTQRVRNAHLHAGEFLGSEMVRAAINSTYQDPTFDRARREVAPIVREAILEWLTRGGVYTMPSRTRRSLGDRLWEHRKTVLALVAGIVIGFLLAARFGSQ